MGTAKKSDGRYVVGMGVENANEYNGSMAYRDIVIQLTEDGATADSVNKLEYLRDYAEYHASVGEPIVPPNVSIWISGNGFSKAVEADDINITEDGFAVGGITYDGEAWDYSNAGQSGGGSSGGTEVFNVVFTASWNDQDQKVITASKTAAEILAAQQAGKYITANYRTIDFDEGTRAIAVNVYADYDGSPYCSVRFLTLYAESTQATSADTMEFLDIYWDTSFNVWGIRSYIYALTPVSP